MAGIFIGKYCVKPGARIVILLGRGWQSLLTVYATLYCGGLYIPLDSTLPMDRLEYILEDSKPTLIIKKQNFFASFDLAQYQVIDFDTIACDDINFSQGQLMLAHHPQHYSAVLYTSGSTGKPKGIVLTHLAIKSFADWAGNLFLKDAKHTIASITPAYFDLSTFDYFSSFQFHATIKFVPDKVKSSPYMLTDFIINEAVSIIYTVPSFLIYWLKRGNINPSQLNLKRVLFAGEVFPVKHLKNLVDLLPTVEFYNLFGPTETNVCFYHKVNRQQLNVNEEIPIGVPVPHAKIKLADKTNELLVKGDCLFTGYLASGRINLPTDNDGWFHTHDKLTQSSCGFYHYNGRLDRIIKLYGHRIDLLEIESIATNYDDVVLSVADLLINGANENKLALLVHVEDAFDKAAFFSYLKKKLVRVCLPQFIVNTNKIPLLPNGKVDYRTVQIYLRNSYEKQFNRVS